jgi:hypothetical protein
MAFEFYEISRQLGEPFMLYLFTYGGEIPGSPSVSQSFAYTDAEQMVVHGGNAYEPLAIMRDAITASGSLDRSALAVRMQRDAGFASLFQIWPPTQVITLVIRQGHIGDADADRLVVWSGRVLSVGREGDECVISCEPVSSSLRRPGLRRHYQIGCPHVLYGAQCQASRPAATVTATIASISGLSVTLNAGWEGVFPAAKFLDGLLTWVNDNGSTETRRILSVNSNTLSLNGFLRDLEVAMSVDVILGCNHQMDDCADLHNNIHNHGGCPWIPVKNPVGIRNQFY